MWVLLWCFPFAHIYSIVLWITCEFLWIIVIICGFIVVIRLNKNFYRQPYMGVNIITTQMCGFLEI